MTMRPTSILMLAAVLLAGGSTARSADQPKHDPRAAFAETDANRDGAVDHEEFHVRIVEVFYFADADKNGFLDEKELHALAFPDSFTEDDKDNNGRVSLREFLRVRLRDFDDADTDDDEVLTVDEVVVAFEGKGR